jgi:hypothetical protein
VQRRSATPEDLPPLDLRELRMLDLSEPSAPGRAPHLAAASGVVQRAGFVYVVADDELALGEFELSREAPGRLRRVLEGELPVEHRERKKAKPDFEALTALPPFAGNPYGALVGLGSGSTTARDHGFVWRLGSDGSLNGEPGVIDLEPLYSLLRRELDELNIEGAAVMGDRFWLMQRGNSELGLNVVAELSLAEVMESMHRDRTFAATELLDLHSYDLGAIADERLTFSDASSLGSDLLVFTASAEGSGGTYEDGAILGSVVGTMDVDRNVRRLRTIDRRYKVEGVHATLDTGVLSMMFVCDQDDESVPSPLLSATMPLNPGVE